MRELLLSGCFFSQCWTICGEVTFSRNENPTRPVLWKGPILTTKQTKKQKNKIHLCCHFKGPHLHHEHLRVSSPQIHLSNSQKHKSQHAASPLYFVIYVLGLQTCYLPWTATPKPWPSCRRLWTFYWPTSWSLSTGKRKWLISITRTSCCSWTTGSCRTSRRPWTTSWSAVAPRSSTPSKQVWARAWVIDNLNILSLNWEGYKLIRLGTLGIMRNAEADTLAWFVLKLYYSNNNNNYSYSLQMRVFKWIIIK